MLSINRYDDSDAGTIVNGGDLDSSMAMTEVRGGQSSYNGNQSEYSTGNVIVLGDANSSYQGSETSIKILGSTQRSRFGV
jgi:hypothetical protein